MGSKSRLTALSFLLAAAGCAGEVSVEAEESLGDEYAAVVASQLPLSDDAALVSYVDSLGHAIAGVADSSGRSWEFHVVESAELNAFAIPGGHIYINRGLAERAPNLAALAGVLGHEIGHVTLRHSLEQMEQRGKANIVVTLFCGVTGWCANEAAQVLINVGGSAVFARFSRKDESESDAVAVDYLVRAGIDPSGIPELFELLLADRRARPDALSTFFASHPLEEERVRRTKELIETLPPRTLEGLKRTR